MKIQSKLTLTSIILIFGLLFSSGIFFVRIFNVYQLQNYVQKTLELDISMNRFMDRNLSLFTETGKPTAITDLWFRDLVEFHNDVTSVMKSRALKHTSKNYRDLVSIREKTWEDLLRDQINPIQSQMNRIGYSDLLNGNERSSFYHILVEKKNSGSSQDVKTLEIVDQYLHNLYLALNVFSFSVDALIIKAEEELDRYIQQSIIITLGTVAVIILATMIFSLRFSNNLVHRITATNDQVQDIAEGKLKFEQTHTSKYKDEFDELLNHYQMFSHILSDRLDSLKFLLKDIGNTLGNETNIEELQETIVELGMDSVGAESGMFFLADAQSESLELVHRIGFCPPPFHLDKTVTSNRSNVENYYETHPIIKESPVFGAILAGEQGIFIKNNESERVLPYNSDHYEWLFISSLMALPLIVSNRLLGMLVFYKKTQGEVFSDLDFTFFQAFTDYTAQSVDNVHKYRTLLENREIQREIDIAAGIQKRLLPQELPSFPNGSAEIYSHPARGISGDYFDAIRLDEKRILYTICDVAGKGVPASMLMIMIRTILHTISHKHKNAHTLLRELNYHIAGRIGVDQYATMAVFILDTENREISYSNAAHHPLYIYRHKENHFRSFDTEGLPIGVDKQGQFGHKRIKLYKGDYIFLFTDGLPEARNARGEELSNEKLLKLLSRNTELNPRDLTKSITEYLDNYSENAKQHDDQTFLALKISYNGCCHRYTV